jgi:hypothetical protein
LARHLESLAARARDYVEAASSANTRRGYPSDLAAFCQLVPAARRRDVSTRSPGGWSLHHRMCVTGDKKPNSVSTIERRLSSLG